MTRTAPWLFHGNKMAPPRHKNGGTEKNGEFQRTVGGQFKWRRVPAESQSEEFQLGSSRRSYSWDPVGRVPAEETSEAPASRGAVLHRGSPLELRPSPVHSASDGLCSSRRLVTASPQSALFRFSCKWVPANIGLLWFCWSFLSPVSEPLSPSPMPKP